MEFQLREGSEYIELIKLLKALNLVYSGAEAKQMVDEGNVILNGEVEYRKRAKVRDGDVVQFLNQKIKVIND
jgi:ribosome-associated protein